MKGTISLCVATRLRARSSMSPSCSLFLAQLAYLQRGEEINQHVGDTVMEGKKEKGGEDSTLRSDCRSGSQPLLGSTGGLRTKSLLWRMSSS